MANTSETFKIARDNYVESGNLVKAVESSIFRDLICAAPYTSEQIEGYTYVVIKNRPDNDRNYMLCDPNHLGKVSMAGGDMGHVLVCPADMSNPNFTFNCLSIEATLVNIQRLEAMSKVAHDYAKKFEIENPLLYFHCSPDNSINWLHLHVLDPAHLGPTHTYYGWKNLPFHCVVEVLRNELQY
jgi:hypothetical protein